MGPGTRSRCGAVSSLGLGEGLRHDGKGAGIAPEIKVPDEVDEPQGAIEVKGIIIFGNHLGGGKQGVGGVGVF